MLNTNDNLIINLTDQNNSTQILPNLPTISSQTSWQSLFLSQYDHPPHKTPEHVLAHHVIAIAQNHDQSHLHKHLKRLEGITPSSIRQYSKNLQNPS